MRAVRRRGTVPEVALRRELHRRGLRYRVDHWPVASLRTRADIVFTRARVAVFVDGCFWHGCPVHWTRPASNTQWWLDKIERNMQRDSAATQALTAYGWRVVRVWEHDDLVLAATRIQELLGE